MSLDSTYDCLIVGAGIAGLALGICLTRKGRSVAVLEAKKTLNDKACGDGISLACFPLFETPGITEDDLLERGANPIYRKYEYWGDKWKVIRYKKPSFGLSRAAIMDALYTKALEQGVEIFFGEKAEKYEETDGIYILNERFAGKNLVDASGAISSFSTTPPSDLPFGISSRIWGEAKDLDPNAFHFFYGREFEGGYGWLFPIGDRLWNIGTWNVTNPKNVLPTYRDFERDVAFAKIRFEGYDRAPGGAFIGASFEKTHSSLPRIGDAAYHASYSSGEGITYALYDAIALSATL